MATGSQADIYNRLIRSLPPWFGDSPPILGALLQGIAYGLSFIYSIYVYAKAQSRIKTATDAWLDMIAADFFGSAIRRKANQSDASFLATIIANLFRERATRHSIIQVLTELTGNVPTVFEPMRPADTGSYGGPAIGYSAAGGYGSMLLPYQAFVTAYRPTGSGIPNVAGYGGSTGGYGMASEAEYASLTMVTGQIQDADIYAAVDSVRPAATIVWVAITGNKGIASTLDYTFVLDQSTLG